jgi:hypothetical protein
LLKKDLQWPHMQGVAKAGTFHFYDLALDRDKLGDLIGKLLIEWGPGDRSWIQRADNQDKTVTELWPEFKEPEFPGFMNFLHFPSSLEF